MGLENDTGYPGPLVVHHLPITLVYIQIAHFSSFHLSCLLLSELNLVEKGYTKLSQSPCSSLFCLVWFVFSHSIFSKLPFWEGEEGNLKFKPYLFWSFW